MDPQQKKHRKILCLKIIFLNKLGADVAAKFTNKTKYDVTVDFVIAAVAWPLLSSGVGPTTNYFFLPKFLQFRFKFDLNRLRETILNERKMTKYRIYVAAMLRLLTPCGGLNRNTTRHRSLPSGTNVYTTS